MFQKIKIIHENHRNFLRIIRYALIAILLLLVTWMLDYKFAYLKDGVPDVLLLSSDVTSSFLSSLTGTFLTITTFTFTTILTVLNKYSGSFTPRIVQDFIDRPHVLSLFGIFIGGFFYTVLSLFLVEKLDTSRPLLAGTIAIIYAIAAMVAFMLFVKQVLNDIQVSNVIENVYNKASSLIDSVSEEKRMDDQFNEDAYEKEYKIYADHSGYFYEADDEKLLRQLKDIQADFVIKKRIGEFILGGIHIASLYVKKDLDMDEEEKKDLFQKLSDSLLINVKKNDQKDYHHEITKLVEIAMKALSPGINDPNTAVEAIRKIGILLGQLFSMERHFLIIGEDEETKIIYMGYSAEEELQLSFNQILHYGKSDPLVAEAILNSIRMIYLVSGSSLKSQVEQFFNYCYNLCMASMDNEVYKNQLKEVREAFNDDKK